MADLEGYEKFKAAQNSSAPSIDGYQKFKAQLASTGFNPSPTDRGGNGSQGAAPPPAQTRPGRVGRVLDFTRRAFMGDSVKPTQRSTVQNAFRDAQDLILGVSHLLGQGAVEGGKLVKDAAVSSIAPLKQILGVSPAPTMVDELNRSPLGQRAGAFPGQVAEATSPEGRKMAKEMLYDPVAESFKKSLGLREGKKLIKQPTVDNFKEFVKAPIKAFHEHPLFTLMDWSAVGSIAGQGVKTGLRLTGKAAKAAGNIKVAGMVDDALSTQREALSVAPRTEIPRKFSENPFVKYGLQKPTDKIANNPAVQEFVSNNQVLKWLAPDQFLTPEARAGRVAGKTAQQAQNEFYRLRNERMEQAMQKFKAMPDNEREAFVAVVQGRAMPRQMSPQFRDAYEWYKNTVADEQAKFNLPDETVKRVAYQPLATARGLLTPDDYAAALRGDEAAMTKVRTVTDELAKARIRVQEQALAEWLGETLDRAPQLEVAVKYKGKIYKNQGPEVHADIMQRIADETGDSINEVSKSMDSGFVSGDKYLTRLQASELAKGQIGSSEHLSSAGYMDRRKHSVFAIKRMAREMAEETAPDPIYFPSVFQDKIKISDFMPTKFLQRFKPGFMKGRTGAWGFIEKEPDVAFAIHQSQVERYLQNEAMITAIKEKFATPIKSQKELKPGYKVFAPDGYIGFYKGSMPLQEAFLRGVGLGQNVDDAFLSAVQKVLPGMMPEDKSFLGVRKPQLYQIPADVADKVQEMINPQPKVPELFKLVYDKPVQAFKFSVLAMSPRWVVNNTIGNIVTSMIGRVSPESFVRAGKKAFKDLVPPEVTQGGFRRAEFPALKKVVAPSTGWSDKLTGFFSGRTPTEGVLRDVQNVVSRPVRAVEKFADTVFEVNSQVEDIFRKAAFIDKTTKAAVEEITKRSAGGIAGMKTGLDRFLERGSFSDSNVAKVASEMLKDEGFKSSMVQQVNNILNDYNSLSKWERGVVRRVVPFWSWWKFVNMMFWSMPVKDPAMAQVIKGLGQAGQEIAKEEWKNNGLDVKEIPTWIRGNIILGRTPDDKMLELLNTRSINPLSAAVELPGLSPHFQVFEERRTGKNYLTGAPFTHPDEVEHAGAFYRMENGVPVRLDRPTPPPLATHILRQFPQVNILEALAFPFRTYTGEGLFNNAVRAVRGREQPVKPSMKIANILGLPVTEVDWRRLKRARVDANQAGLKILRQMKRSDNALERIRMGENE